MAIVSGAPAMNKSSYHYNDRMTRSLSRLSSAAWLDMLEQTHSVVEAIETADAGADLARHSRLFFRPREK